MTISANVRKELFEMTSAEGKLIRIKPTEAKAGTTVYSSKQAQPLKMWTQEEHERFLEAMEKYPAGPWKVIASFIGSKTTRQTMTHAQKYRQKISRWRRGLRHKGRKQVVVDAASIASSSSDEAEFSAREHLFKAIEYVSGDDMSVCSSMDYNPPGNQLRSPVRSLSSIRYDGRSEREMNGGEGRSELFKLAELASFEVMKQEPPRSPVLHYGDAARRMELKQQQQQQFEHHQRFLQQPQQQFVDYDMQQPVDEPSCEYGNYNNKLKHEKLSLAPSKEWCTRKTEIKLSPLRSVGHVDTHVMSAVRGLNSMTSMHNRIDLRALAAVSNNNNSNMSMLDCASSSDDEDRRSFATSGHAIRLPPLHMAGGNVQTSHAFAIPPLRSKIDPNVLARAQFAASNN